MSYSVDTQLMHLHLMNSNITQLECLQQQNTT